VNSGSVLRLRDSARMGVEPVDPWSVSLALLSRRVPSARIGRGVLRTRWEPERTLHPRSRERGSFAPERAAFDFVAAQLRRVVREGGGGRAGKWRWIRWRIEPFGQHAGTDACVLEIAGAPGCRGTYVKWFLARAEGAEPVVVFVSFHSTDRSNR
jgi:hypothetical protein